MDAPRYPNLAEVGEWIDGRLRNEGTPVDPELIVRVLDLEHAFLIQKRLAPQR